MNTEGLGQAVGSIQAVDISGVTCGNWANFYPTNATGVDASSLPDPGSVVFEVQNVWPAPTLNPGGGFVKQNGAVHFFYSGPSAGGGPLPATSGAPSGSLLMKASWGSSGLELAVCLGSSAVVTPAAQAVQAATSTSNVYMIAGIVGVLIIGGLLWAASE
jgi:hypothetical protein